MHCCAKIQPEFANALYSFCNAKMTMHIFLPLRVWFIMDQTKQSLICSLQALLFPLHETLAYITDIYSNNCVSLAYTVKVSLAKKWASKIWAGSSVFELPHQLNPSI